MSENKSDMPVKKGVTRRDPQENDLVPLVDIYETADGTVYLEAELPGANRDTLDIRVEKGVLTIAAEAEVPSPGAEFTATYRGFESGRYFRAFALSDEVDRDKIEAELSDGVLKVTLPRAASAATRTIQIKQG
jgi:HSP20 family molecular chaperone IbpA